jgi:hypothetical protein
MSQNNLTRNVAYDNPTAVARQGFWLGAPAAGSGGVSPNKFQAWTAAIVWGVRFRTTTAGTSTYTVSGTATNPATQFSVIYITNTNTTGTAVTLATTTVGPFTVGGTATAGTNAFVGGQGGGIAGGYNGPYAINTLGGTNTSLTWGTLSYIAYPGTATGSQIQVGYPGGQNIGIGGLPVNEGDQVYVVSGTDATAVIDAWLEYSVAPGPGPALGGVARIGDNPGNITA